MRGPASVCGFLLVLLAFQGASDDVKAHSWEAHVPGAYDHCIQHGGEPRNAFETRPRMIFELPGTDWGPGQIQSLQWRDWHVEGWFRESATTTSHAADPASLAEALGVDIVRATLSEAVGTQPSDNGGTAWASSDGETWTAQEGIFEEVVYEAREVDWMDVPWTPHSHDLTVAFDGPFNLSALLDAQGPPEKRNAAGLLAHVHYGDLSVTTYVPECRLDAEPRMAGRDGAAVRIFAGDMILVIPSEPSTKAEAYESMQAVVGALRPTMQSLEPGA